MILEKTLWRGRIRAHHPGRRWYPRCRFAERARSDMLALNRILHRFARDRTLVADDLWGYFNISERTIERAIAYRFQPRYRPRLSAFRLVDFDAWPPNARRRTRSARRADSRFLRVMPDYASDGLWNDHGALWADDLPLGPPIKDRLAAWCRAFEANAPWKWPDDAEPPFDAAFDAAFDAEGWAIARAIKAEHPHWTVVYGDAPITDGAPLPAAPRLSPTRTGEG